MRVLRGRGETIEADRRCTDDTLRLATETGTTTLRVWTPHRQVSFGRRDVRATGYERARLRARANRFEPVERDVGGTAVAYTGTTIAFALAQPVANLRRGMQDRYERVTSAVQRALWHVGVPAQRGEPPGAFCPGSHSLSYHGKLVGVAQRVRRDAALVGGICVVDGHAEIADVLAPVYEELGLALDRDAVGSVERAGASAEPTVVARAIEDRLTAGHETTVEQVADDSGVEA